MREFELSIQSIEQPVYILKVGSLRVETTLGKITFLYGHAPFRGILGHGKIYYDDKTLDCGGGLIKVGDNRAEILLA
ncbi:MAG: hypothetical protein KKH83_06160 [Candidatus Margulisbacteria bacterium]|nr:hypothetical protein [Candidatus Margulisiibacteriota bacterium]